MLVLAGSACRINEPVSLDAMVESMRRSAATAISKPGEISEIGMAQQFGVPGRWCAVIIPAGSFDAGPVAREGLSDPEIAAVTSVSGEGEEGPRIVTCQIGEPICEDWMAHTTFRDSSWSPPMECAGCATRSK